MKQVYLMDGGNVFRFDEDGNTLLSGPVYKNGTFSLGLERGEWTEVDWGSIDVEEKEYCLAIATALHAAKARR